MVGKMAKDVGTEIYKSIVVFLPCLVAFLGLHPKMVLQMFFYCNLFLLFFRGEKYSLQRCVVTVALSHMTMIYP